MQLDRMSEMWVRLPPSHMLGTTAVAARGKQCPYGLGVRRRQTAYDGQRDVTGRAGLTVGRTTPVHERR